MPLQLCLAVYVPRFQSIKQRGMPTARTSPHRHHRRRGLPGDHHPEGAQRRLLRAEHPGRPGRLLPAPNLSEGSIAWEETVQADTGTLGLTTKHLYFSGSRKKFRVRYDRIVSFDTFSDGFGIMRDAQTAKPQTFITGDGWFVYNLAVNLAQM